METSQSRTISRRSSVIRCRAALKERRITRSPTGLPPMSCKGVPGGRIRYASLTRGTSGVLEARDDPPVLPFSVEAMTRPELKQELAAAGGVLQCCATSPSTS